jgi:hypothetical protein
MPKRKKSVERPKSPTESVNESHFHSTNLTNSGAALSRRRFLEIATGSSIASIVSCGLLRPAGTVQNSSSPGRSRLLADIPASSMDHFIDRFEGRIVRPSDQQYETLRRTWNFKYDKHPALIAVCASVADVQRAVSFAAEHEVLLAVRSGGHSLAGYSSCNGGIVLVMSELHGVKVDVSNQRAVISGGTTIGGVDAELSKHGLATPGAGASTVGYAGFATGGGRGTISPRYGYACDNIEEMEIVTADGELRTVSATSEQDLYWAVRGGGGNFGVVTRFDVRAHPVTDVVGGNILFPFRDARSVMKRIRDLFDSLPDELYVAPILTGTPEGPAMAVSFLYCGPIERAEAEIAPYRAIGNSVVDTISVLPYLETQAWFPGPPQGTATEGCTGFFPTLTDEVIDALVASAGSGPAAFTIPSFSMHGAMADKNLDDNAYPLREKGVDFFAMGFWTSPANREETGKWVRDLWSSVVSSTRGVSVNGVFDRSLERARDTYRDKYNRLAKMKKTYDPTNLFSENVNVIPEN